jgi:hypothetical protein
MVAKIRRRAMGDYILSMQNDTVGHESDTAWEAYFELLQSSRAFGGGSAIGAGIGRRKSGDPAPPSHHLTGYIRVQAASVDEARRLVPGNPTFECGGTVGIRALPTD